MSLITLLRKPVGFTYFCFSNGRLLDDNNHFIACLFSASRSFIVYFA